MVNFGNDWDEVLAGEFDKEYYLKLRAFLKSEYSTRTIYPDMYDIFNALKYTPYKNVRAVILGQDPYHGPGQAHGLCFSVQKGVAPPPSLVNIFKEIKSDLGIDKSAILSQIEAGGKRRKAREEREQLKNLEAGISARLDKVNPVRRDNPRAAKAEETLIFILYHNPDKAKTIKELMSPEKMISDFSRRLYTGLMDMIDEGSAPSLSPLGQFFSPEEMSHCARIINSSIKKILRRVKSLEVYSQSGFSPIQSSVL